MSTQRFRGSVSWVQVAMFALLFAFVVYLVRLLFAPPQYRPTWELMHSPQLPNTVLALAFSPDENFLASGGHDYSGGFGRTRNWGVVTLWDLRTGKLVRELRIGEQPSPTALAFTSDGKHLIIGESEFDSGGIGRDLTKCVYKNRGRIRILDVTTFKETVKIELKWSVYGLAVSPDGEQLAAIGSGGPDEVQVGLWNLATGEEQKVWSFPGPPTIVGQRGHPLRQIIFSHDGKKILAVTRAGHMPNDSVRSRTIEEARQSRPGGIQIIDTDSLELVNTWRFPNGGADWIDISWDNKLIAAIGQESIFYRWEIPPDWDMPKKLGNSWDLPFRFLKDGRRQLYVHRDNRATCLGAIRDIETKTNRVYAQFQGDMTLNCAFAVSDNEQWFAIGDYEDRINVWKLPRMKATHTTADDK